MENRQWETGQWNGRRGTAEALGGRKRTGRLLGRADSPDPIHRPPVLDPEANGPPRFRRRGHELADGVEDALELRVIPLLQLVGASREIPIRADQFAEPSFPAVRVLCQS